MWQGQINRKHENEPHLLVLLNAEKYVRYMDSLPITLYNMYFAPHETYKGYPSSELFNLDRKVFSTIVISIKRWGMFFVKALLVGKFLLLSLPR